MTTTSINIDITADNAQDLLRFVPVTGSWRINHYDGTEAPSVQDVEESIRNWMDADVSVSVFHADGREIASECPSDGTYVAVRR
jgi:hypothetical protein